jgi:hypothetical protein
MQDRSVRFAVHVFMICSSAISFSVSNTSYDACPACIGMLHRYGACARKKSERMRTHAPRLRL